MTIAYLLYTGAAATVRQLETLTPASVAIGNKFKVTINSKSVEYTAAANTVADVCTGLLALLQASSIAEFRKITWATDNSVITATGPTTGEPFILTTTPTGGTATFGRATTVTATGPNWANNAANYSTAALPVTGDVLTIGLQSPPIKWGMDLHTVQLSKLIVQKSFIGEGAGLSTNNPAGYAEYLPRFFRIGADILEFGVGSGQGCSRFNWDAGSGGSDGIVYSTGNSTEPGVDPLQIIGTVDIEVKTGNVTLCPLPSDAATLATLKQSGGTITVGVSATLGDVTIDNGTLTLFCEFNTITAFGGTVTCNGEGDADTITSYYNATIIYNLAGTLDHADVVQGGTIDFSKDLRTKIVTDRSFTIEGEIIMGNAPVTYTNPPSYTNVQVIKAERS